MHEITKQETEEAIKVERYQENRLEYMTRIATEGGTILVPESDELTIDIDTEEQFERFKTAFKRFKDEYKDKSIIAKMSISRSGLPHRHIVIKAPDFSFSAPERIALQAVLGSDPTREMLSMFRYLNWDSVPSLLAVFNPKWTKIK